MTTTPRYAAQGSDTLYSLALGKRNTCGQAGCAWTVCAAHRMMFQKRKVVRRKPARCPSRSLRRDGYTQMRTDSFDTASGRANVFSPYGREGAPTPPCQCLSRWMPNHRAYLPSRSASSRARCVATGAGGASPLRPNRLFVRLGDTETGLQATGSALREVKAGAAYLLRKYRLGAAGNCRTDARDVGCTHQG